MIAIALLGYMTLWFGYATYLKRDDVADTAWGLGFVCVAWLTLWIGGVLGGISTGMPLVFRVAFKPVSTITKPQQTIKTDGTAATLVNEGRHDPCVLPRAVPIVDAMAALVIMDLLLLRQSTV